MVRRDRGPCPRSKIYLEESSYAKRTRAFVGEDRALCKFRKECVGDPAPAFTLTFPAWKRLELDVKRINTPHQDRRYTPHNHTTYYCC